MSRTTNDTTTPQAAGHGTGHGPHDEHPSTVAPTANDKDADRDSETTKGHGHDHHEHETTTTGREI
jgi:hypothetical protein